MNQRLLPGVLLATAFGCTGALAQGADEADPQLGFRFEPLMLEAKGGSGNVFGVNFQYSKKWQQIAGFDKLQEKAVERSSTGAQLGLMSCGGYAEEQGKTVPTWISFTDCAADISAKGTLTADADKNPNKLLDLSGAYSWIYTRSSRSGTAMFALGAQAKYETDQALDNKQFVFGLRGTFTHLPGCGAGAADKSCPDNPNFLGVSIGLQRVDPSTDNARKAVLGNAPMDNYQRAELEGFYKFHLPKDWRYLSDLEFNYRHFQELNPSDIIRNAGLHRNRLGLVRLNFGWGGKGATAVDPSMFIQYSRGSLPFDTKPERVVKVGLQFRVF